MTDTTMYVTYATRDKDSKDAYCIMPNAVPIVALTSGGVKRNFLRVFEQCFGDTLEVKVLGINRKKVLTFQPERV